MNETAGVLSTATEPEGSTRPRSQPAERGRLEVHRSVLRKIAERAADTVPDTVRVRRRVAGLGFGEHGASARITGPDHRLRVQLDVALRYPAPVPETVRSVRQRVEDELARISGSQVHVVNVTVSALVPADPPPRVE